MNEGNKEYDNAESLMNAAGAFENCHEAIKCYRFAADLGHLDAQYKMGLMYLRGEGVKQDYPESVKWFRMAADAGHAGAQNSLGIRYCRGQGVSLDYEEALKWFRKAADQGFAKARTYLGHMYSLGDGIAQDYKNALYWYQLAVDQGNTDAQCCMGYLYEKGYGVAQDYSEAIKWYGLAADQGNKSAQCHVGCMHYQGFGVEQKYLEAAKWFRLAADQGDSEAQRFLGCMYAEGKGVSQDFAEALKWCKIAAENPSGYFWLLLYTHMQKANVIPRALVVDNSPEALNRIHTLVKESGMECFTSNNAASALLFLEKDLPDVVIVNTAMPDMDGFELCRQLKANENTQHIPVLLSVVSMDSASCVKGFEAGAQDYLSSTMCLAELQHRIKIAAQRYRRHNALLNQLYLQREIIEFEKQILRLESFRFHNNNLLAVAQGYFMFTTEYGYQSTSEDKELYKSGADCIDRLITNHRCLELIIRRRDSNSDVVDVNQMIDDVIAWMDLSIASIYSYHVFPLISQDIDTVKPPHFAQLMNFKIPIRSSIQPGRKWYGSPADVVWTLLCLIQYLMNMFTDQKDPAVEIRDVVIDGNYILVISNNAARIDDKYRGYLLDPISFNTYPFGTAGLYLAQRFAARLGGLLVIKPSELESGNEFMLWLPSDQPKEIKTEKCY